MQIMLDTATDAPAELYKIGKYLVDNYSTSLVAPQDVSIGKDIQNAIDSLDKVEVMAAAEAAALAPPPPPVAPLTYAEVVSDTDPEVEIDDEGNVSVLTATVALLPVAPPPPTPAPPGPAVASELDSRGYPWDGRIHAANRAKKLDGSWKNKRGVDANLVVAVEAQTKPAAAAPVAEAPAAPLATPAAPPAPTAAATAPPAPPPPAPTLGIAAPAAVAPSTTIDFRGLMQKIQAATSSGKLTTEQVNGALATVGLKPEDMGQLIGNVLYIASVNAAIDSCLTG